MIRRPPRSTRKESSAASDVYKRQRQHHRAGSDQNSDFSRPQQNLVILGINENLNIIPKLESRYEYRELCQIEAVGKHDQIGNEKEHQRPHQWPRDQ